MIIGLCGWQGVGKSTVAKQLSSILSGDNNTIILAMAQVLRLEVEDALLVPPPSPDKYLIDCLQKNLTDPWVKPTPPEIRQLLISWGNARRKQNPDYWVNCWNTAFEYLHANKIVEHFIVDDIRYQNEAEKILELGGKLIYLYREGIEQNPELESEDLSWLKNVSHKICDLDDGRGGAFAAWDIIDYVNNE